MAKQETGNDTGAFTLQQWIEAGGSSLVSKLCTIGTEVLSSRQLTGRKPKSKYRSLVEQRLHEVSPVLAEMQLAMLTGELPFDRDRFKSIGELLDRVLGVAPRYIKTDDDSFEGIILEVKQATVAIPNSKAIDAEPNGD